MVEALTYICLRVQFIRCNFSSSIKKLPITYLERAREEENENRFQII